MITKNHECYVSLEVAKLLKEAGFDWPCNHAICCDSTHYPNLKEGDVLEYNHLECSELMEGKKPHMLLCPTLDVAQRWLREVKRIHVEVMYLFEPFNHYFARACYLDTNTPLHIPNPLTSTIYEQAQEAGIKKILTDLLK